MLDPADLIRLAIHKCRVGIAVGQSPFGCAIALDDDVLAVEHNTTWATSDPTAHAEVNALRSACRGRGTIFVEGAIVATTCEPCAMCMAALHWARVDTVYFGATIADASAAGFSELSLAAADVVRLGGSRVKVVGGLLSDECRALFREWRANGGKAY